MSSPETPSTPSIFHVAAQPEPDKKLTDWLTEQGADPETIDKVKTYETLNHAVCIVSFLRYKNYDSLFKFSLLNEQMIHGKCI